MRRFVVIIAILFFASGVSGQQGLALADTVVLDEIVSYGSLRKFQSGSKIQTISSGQINLLNDGSFEQVLSRILPIAFKTDAGGLSTIRIRGTGSSHTSVNFGGIDLNSLTLGQTNFSNIPVYLFDNVDVQFGSASSINGSGSIGGAVHLGLQHNWTKGFKSEIRISNGSFGEQMYGTKLFAGNGKFESVTRAYYFQKRNDFPFLNSTYRDFENGIFEIKDVQKNASLWHFGVLQELNYRIVTGEFFFANIWLENDWRQNQQNMQTNLNNPDYSEEYQDQHVRIWTGYKNRKNNFKYEVSGGYVFDNAINNSNTLDTIRTNRLLFDAFIEHDLSAKSSYKIGLTASKIQPHVYAYSEALTTENRVDFYLSAFHRFFEKLTLSLNLRQGTVSNYKVPFTPSLGFNFMALSQEKYVLNFLGSVARSYRVPTFNDRFWVPGGNPDLKPEMGMNYELGSKWSYCSGEVSGNISLNTFFMQVDDWILWRNGGSFWFADNVQKVESKGLEFSGDWHYQLFGLETVSGFHYSLTSAQRKNSANNTNALNRQLEYVPKHSATVFHTTEWKKLTLSVDGSFTGEQFTDEEDRNILKPYILLNTAVNYKLKLNSAKHFIFSGMINNLLNTSYQSSFGYAMPGISYRLSLTFEYK